MPATAIYFTAYDQLKAFLCGRALTSDLYAPMAAGALARCEHRLGPLISLWPPPVLESGPGFQPQCLAALGWRDLWGPQILGWAAIGTCELTPPHPSPQWEP